MNSDEAKKTGSPGTSPSNSSKSAGPAGKATSGKAGPGGGKPPGGSVNTDGTKRDAKSVGGGSKIKVSQGPTMSANGTKHLSKSPKKK